MPHLRSNTMLKDVDSRERAVDWLHSRANAGSAVAFDNDLPIHVPSVSRAGLTPVRLEPHSDDCSIGTVAVQFVVSPRPRNCGSRLKLRAEFPGRALAQEPLFNPSLYIYETGLEAGAKP
jgi:hypothetical protein